MEYYLAIVMSTYMARATHIMLFNNDHEYNAILQQSWTIYLDVHSHLM